MFRGVAARRLLFVRRQPARTGVGRNRIKGLIGDGGGANGHERGWNGHERAIDRHKPAATGEQPTSKIAPDDIVRIC
jgi:hypothetical protein